ncbi:hypothetical protein ATANTOWER_026122 [Ataeniobius toweri]|uniref:Secreted protein n=1 Tax=Ataeniobius toweri TaxID=208326 RepID=A0ABU7AH09_9TELE|nr:hypothetical protein [Ataeniobius toweri]
MVLPFLLLLQMHAILESSFLPVDNAIEKIRPYFTSPKEEHSSSATQTTYFDILNVTFSLTFCNKHSLCGCNRKFIASENVCAFKLPKQQNRTVPDRVFVVFFPMRHHFMRTTMGSIICNINSE